jgi:pyridoxal phosphate enzyme (YggS family)
MFSLKNYQEIIQELPPEVTLVAVSKTKPEKAILDAYKAGQKDFGENKVQEMVSKYESLPKDICWHMIGHVQRNKIKYMAPFVHLIHGVASEKTLKEINKQALKNNRTIDCLLQVHIAQEDTKFGFLPQEINELLAGEFFAENKNIRVVGLMGMATFTEDMLQVREEFRGLKTLFDELKKNPKSNFFMKILSMGMSGDYHIALQEGSNMVRIGSAIFGERNYIAS